MTEMDRWYGGLDRERRDALEMIRAKFPGPNVGYNTLMWPLGYGQGDVLIALNDGRVDISLSGMDMRTTMAVLRVVLRPVAEEVQE